MAAAAMASELEKEAGRAVTSQFSSLLKGMQGNPLKYSPLSKNEIFSMEYSRISNK